MKLGVLIVLAMMVLLSHQRAITSQSGSFTRCQLKEELGKAISIPSEFNCIKKDILAKVICVLERQTGLNTTWMEVLGGSEESDTATAEEETEQPTNETSQSEAAEEPSHSRKKRAVVSQCDKEDLWRKLSDLDSCLDEEQMYLDDNLMNGEDGDEDEDENWSLGLYGLFALSNSHFCDSGTRWSRNVCNKSCNDFLNNNIADDIACFVDSCAWRLRLDEVDEECPDLDLGDFFSDCP